jgi:hypothetical protein
MPSAAITVTKISRKKNFHNYKATICNHAWHEGIRRWSIDPLILDVCTRWRQWTSCLSKLPLPSNSPNNHWQKTGWVPMLLLELWRREKYFSPTTNKTIVLSFSVQNVVAIMTMLSWFCKNKIFKTSYIQIHFKQISKVLRIWHRIMQKKHIITFYVYCPL